MKFTEWRTSRPASTASVRRWLAVAAVLGLGLAASGCAQSMSEFARDADGTASSAYPASAQPTTLAPGNPGTVASRPAVMVEERTVAASPAPAARTTAPMAIAPPAAETASVAPPSEGIAPSVANLNRVPEQPKGKLLTPTEKAKVIAELEALAKKQGAALDKSRKAACASDDLNPAQRVASATGDGGC